MLSDVQRTDLKRKNIRLIVGLTLAIGLLVALLGVQLQNRKSTSAPDIFVGIDIGYGNEEVALKLIDKVANYVNLIILGSLEVTTDTEKLTRVCEYMYQKDLHFIIYVGFGESGYTPPRGPDSQFFTSAANKWGDKFLGVYLFDEVGGKLIDDAHSINITAAADFSDAASIYTHHLNFFLGNVSEYYAPAKFKLFSSDYALYWYDYLSGYDVVFGEFVGNQSRQVAVGLCRGAAKTQGKDWGTVITWKYQKPPYLEDEGQLYDDMVLAYENGAKYILVFNSPGYHISETNSSQLVENPTLTEYGILTTEHLDAMKKFWNYVNAEPDVEQYPANTAYVLPRDYGYGFRGPDDKIWGEWEADTLSPQLWNDVSNLLATYGSYLDVVYETRIGDSPINLPYDKLIFWNGTVIEK